MTKLTTIKPFAGLERKKRVAGYSRVSSGKDAMLHSLSSQISYFSALIQSHNDWVYVGVYADEAKTGTKENRPEFQRLMDDCRAGLIDIVITKSISRFARNTVTLLESVRELKALGVDVFFEEQNLHTLSGDGELMLTILAGYAQEESKSVSDNMKWRIRKNFEEGKPWSATILGYRYKNGQYIIEPAEAETVKLIFDLYLSGKGYTAIARELNREGVSTRVGKKWYPSAIQEIIRNRTYTDDLLLQMTYRLDAVSKKKKTNQGELPKYCVEEAHEAIITEENFDLVQAELAKRAATAERHSNPLISNMFKGKLVCECCGKKYKRKKGSKGFIWVCSTYNSLGKDACASKQIPEETLMKTTAAMLETTELYETSFEERVLNILVCNGNRLIYRMKDESEKELIWEDRSRSESWTPLMREKARQKELTRREGKHA